MPPPSWCVAKGCPGNRTPGNIRDSTLSTTSPAERSHVACVLYEAIGTTLYVNTLRTSRNARNAAANPHVAVAILIRRLPMGPPSTVQFQGTAEVLDVDGPRFGH